MVLLKAMAVVLLRLLFGDGGCCCSCFEAVVVERRWLVVACELVRTSAVCRSAASSAMSVYFQRRLRVLICCVDFL